MASPATVAALMVKLGLDKKGYDKGLKDAESKARKTTRSVKALFAKWTIRAAAVAGIVKSAQALGRMAEAGGRALTVQAAFNRVTGDGTIALRKLRRATAGLVTDTELMTQANMALTLGSANNAQQFSKLAKTAQQLGRALGLDTAFALNSLNVGIARQSRLVLDNLGLIVSVTQANETYAASIGKTVAQLTDAEKKEAFRLEAMSQAGRKLAELGPMTMNAGDQFRTLATEITNSVDALKKWLAESEMLGEFFSNMADWAAAFRGDFSRMRKDFEELQVSLGLLTAEEAQMREFTRSLLESAEAMSALARTQETLRGLEEQALATKALREEVALLKTQLEGWTATKESLEQGIGGFGFLGPERAAERQVAAFNKEWQELNTTLDHSIDHMAPLGYKVGEVMDRIRDSEAHRRMMAEGLRSIGDEARYAASGLGTLSQAQSILSNAFSLFGGGMPGILGGFLSKIGSFSGLMGGLQGLSPGKIAKKGLAGKMPLARAAPASGGITVVLNGPGLNQLVDTITVEQDRASNLRRIERI